MKNLSIILVLLFAIPFVNQAADKDLKKLFNKYGNVSGFELENENTNMDFDFDGDWGFGDFLDEIENIYILSFDKEKGGLTKLNDFQAKLSKLMDKKGFTTLVDIDGDGKVQILSRKDGGEKTTDYLVITEGDDEALFIWASTD